MMRKLLLIAGLALGLPGLAAAQSVCMQQHHVNRAAGAAAGAALDAKASYGPRDAGAVMVASAAAVPAAACGGFTAVGFYDGDGVWHAGPGYYDADGDWRQANGYYDQEGNWVDVAPPSPPRPSAPPPSATDFGADVAYTGTNGVNGR